MRRRSLLQLVYAGLAVVTLQACDVGSASMPPPPLATVEQVPIAGLAPATLTLPNSPNSVKFAVIGDSGRGNQAQRDVAEAVQRLRGRDDLLEGLPLSTRAVADVRDRRG